ncbi:hypothetical protein AAFF_G00321920, partial [Aldrovandia affinis]
AAFFSLLLQQRCVRVIGSPLRPLIPAPLPAGPGLLLVFEFRSPDRSSHLFQLGSGFILEHTQLKMPMGLQPCPSADNPLLLPMTIIQTSDHSDLPILPPQHPEDPTVPHPRGHTTPGPGPGDLTSGVLQFLAGRPTGLCYQTTATSPECCRSSGVQPTEVHPRHPSTLLSELAPHRSMHQIQITGACFSSG